MSTAFAYDPVRRPAPALPVAPAPVAAAPAPAAAPAALHRPRVLAVSLLVGGAATVVAAQLLLSIGTADGAYRLAELQQRSTSLSRETQVASERLQALGAPQRLAARATALGMVPDDSPAYLDASSGAVLGAATPTKGDASAPGGILR